MAMAAPCQAASAGAGSRRADSRPLRLAKKGKGFHALRARVHFLCLARENRTKREATPFPRFAGIPARKVRVGLRGFSEAHPCAFEKRADVVSAPLRASLPGLALLVRQGSRKPPPLHRGPGRASAHPARQKRAPGAHATADRSPLCFSGPLWKRWVVDEKARRGECRDALAFSPAQDVLSKSPAATHVPEGQDARRARTWGALLFTPGILPSALRASCAVQTRSRRVCGSVSLGHAREMNSRPKAVKRF